MAILPFGYLDINIFNLLIVVDKDGAPVTWLVCPVRNWSPIEEETLRLHLAKHGLVGKDRHAAEVGFQRVAGPRVEQVVVSLAVLYQEALIDPRGNRGTGRLTDGFQVLTPL